jgi:TatA/E family protein of Tat protein translocase
LGSCKAILAAEGRVFGTIGMPELILIFVVALLLFGPRKMPQIGRSIGRALGEFRRASNDFKRTIEDEVAADEIREVERDLKEIREVGHDVVRGVDLGTPDDDAREQDST